MERKRGRAVGMEEEEEEKKEEVVDENGRSLERPHLLYLESLCVE